MLKACVLLVHEELRTGVQRQALDLPPVTGAIYCLFVPPEKPKLPPIATFVAWLQQVRQSPGLTARHAFAAVGTI